MNDSELLNNIEDIFLVIVSSQRVVNFVIRISSFSVTTNSSMMEFKYHLFTTFSHYEKENCYMIICFNCELFF